MQRLRILLVDDNPVEIELAEVAFAEHQEVARLVTRTSARAALETLCDVSVDMPDVVVLDVNMPLMSGLELLQVMKSDPMLQDIPVVMLSTSASPMDVKLAYTLHASSYRVKAHSFPEFLKQVDDFLHYWCRCQLPRERPRAAGGPRAPA
ncbi:response regulator [Deinococcus sp. KSM4-11]|uniref:response regulator n=1 Tax=Deinococcus sp. KSM4-11 TaxID=2568654 RepID=UPI0010A2CC75|nr:response regulator [Deinococcus sp. KSM4-11]THF84368.1 response regulator [Deinococcus sp. KSM4-11]